MAGKGLEAMRPLTLIDYAKIVWRARLLIVALAAVAAVVAFSVASRMPKIYYAKATVLPPTDAAASQGAGVAAMSLLGSLTGAQGGGGSLTLPGLPMLGSSMATSADIFLAVLKSRSMREDVMSDFKKMRGPDV